MRWGTWMILALLLCLGIGCTRPSHPAPPDVEALSQGARWAGAQSEVALGEPIDMRLWVVIDLTKKAFDPGFLEPGLMLTRREGPQVENARLEPTDEAEMHLRETKLLFSRPYRLTWLRLGEQTLPPIEIHQKGSDAKFSTQTLDFEVAGVLTDEDAKAVEIPTELFQDAPTSYRLLYWLLGVVVLAVAIGWWLQHRLKGVMHQVELGPAISAIEEARERLRQVDAAWQEQELDGESLVVAVSGVLRTYLQKGLGFHSLTHTTEEFLAELRSSDLVPITVQTPLAAFLQQCDLIKFAAQGSDAELSKSLLSMTHDLLDDAEKIEIAKAHATSPLDPARGPRLREELAHRG